MAYAFDTLSYAKRLRDAGIAQQHAEAHAEAAREFVMGELATKADVLVVKADVLAVKSRCPGRKSRSPGHESRYPSHED